jgi:hypothetical protein
MKTAMQELIEYLEKDYYINELTNFDKDKIKFLEKEKEQIINAYNQADLEGYFQKTYPKYAEDYYNQTYNN